MKKRNKENLLKKFKKKIHKLEDEKKMLEYKAELGMQVGCFAHDINNILTIFQYAEFIPELLDDLNERNISLINEYAHCILEATQIGKELTSGFTNYLKDTDTEIKLQSIIPFLQVLKIYTRRFKGQIIEEIENDIPSIRCKAYQVKRLIINIFSNSMQAIEICKNKDKLIKIKIWSENDCVFLSITDSGSGIPKDIICKIFQEGFTTKKEGTGLGLAIVKQIVEENNWSITVESSEKGTTFTVSFQKSP